MPRSESAYNADAHLYNICKECGFVDEKTPRGGDVDQSNLTFFKTESECIKCGSDEILKGWSPQLKLVVKTVDGKFHDLEGTPNRTSWTVDNFSR